MLTVMLYVVTKLTLYSLILLAVLWCWFQLSHWRILRAAAKIPCPRRALPIIGHAHYSWKDLTFSSDDDFDTKSGAFQGMKHCLVEIPTLLVQKACLIWLKTDAVFQFMYKSKLKKVVNYWENFVECTLKKASIKPITKPDTPNARESDGKSQLNDRGQVNFFDVYKSVQASLPNLSDKDLKAELLTLFLTGSDSVGLTTSSCLLALASYRHIQDKLVQEVMSVVGQDDDVTSQDLSNMPYLDQVYKETLRFFTIVSLIGRRATEDIKLGSFLVPAGATLVVSLGALNRNPKVFRNPTDFDPDHFSPQNKTSDSKMNVILPFSGGPRGCIGKRYTDMLVKILIINVVRKFKISTNMDIHSLKRKIAMAFVCTEGYNISLEPRN